MLSNLSGKVLLIICGVVVVLAVVAVVAMLVV